MIVEARTLRPLATLIIEVICHSMLTLVFAPVGGMIPTLIAG